MSQFNPNDNYNSITKDSTLLAKQVTGTYSVNKVKGTTAMNQQIDSYLTAKAQIERKATLNKQLLEDLSVGKRNPPAILLNEYGTVAQESVDQIYDTEGRRVNQGVSLMKENFQKWVRDKQSPINERALVKLALVDEQADIKQRQERRR